MLDLRDLSLECVERLCQADMMWERRSFNKKFPQSPIILVPNYSFRPN